MTIIRQKLTRPVPQDGGAEEGWRLALPRAAMEASGLDLAVMAVTTDTVSAAGLAQVVPDHALILMLTGPEGGRGAMILSPQLTSAVVEVQMTGRIAAQGASRKPTRIDAALATGLAEAALSGLDAALATQADRVWAAGFRIDVHLADADGLALAFAPGPLRLLSAQLALAGGLREATVMLALPAEGRGTMPATADAVAAAAESFRTDLSTQVMGAEVALEGVLCRLTLPLGAVLGLKVGEAIPLPRASVDQVQVETACGRTVTQGRLGQNRGMRALRLSAEEQQSSLAEAGRLRIAG